MFEAIRNLFESILGKSVVNFLVFALKCLVVFWAFQVLYRTIRDIRAGYKGGFDLGKEIGKNFTKDECDFIVNDPDCKKFIRDQIRSFQDYETRSYTVDYNDIYTKVIKGMYDVPSFQAYRAPKVREKIMARVEAYRAEQARIAAPCLKVQVLLPGE